MNFSKKHLSKISNKKNIRKKRRSKGTSVLIQRSVLSFVLVIIAAILIFGAVYIRNLIKALPDIKTIDISPTGYSSKIYNKDGKEIETLAASGANREYVKIKNIPKDLQHAFVAIEDSRFYKHNGVDLKGLMRAMFNAVISRGKVHQGASTITQQLLKNNYFTGWTSEHTLKNSIDRKIQEQYFAIQLEKIKSKNTILENYLNSINLGQNTLGVQAASKRYFNKDVSDLTLSEDAVIAAITQNPSKYNPISNPKENAKRRSTVLKYMLDQGYISKDKYKKAIADDVYSRIKNANVDISVSNATSYFVDALTDSVIKDLVKELGLSETEAFRKLYSGGLRIYSTQDSKIQKVCDDTVNDNANYPGKPKYSFSYRLSIKKQDGTLKNYSEQTMLTEKRKTNPNFSINYPTKEKADEAIEEYKQSLMKPGDKIPKGGEKITYTLQPQIAMTIMDQKNGHVIALVGGRGDKKASKTLNRASNVTRQPGSTFKIITTYAPALDSAGLTLATVQDNAPYSYTNGKKIRNMPDTYTGYTSLRVGIRDSINVVAVKTLTEIGTSLGFHYAEDFGISTLESGDNNQALAIGGITNGVKNVELTAAYATIANKGVYHKPIYYTKILDHQGHLLLDNSKREHKKKRVIKETTAWLLTSAMRDVMTSGTGKIANITDMPVAGKTGTTNDAKDYILEGFSPYYTCGIWGGYDDNSNQPEVSYTHKLWRIVMQKIHEGLKKKDFTMPSGIVKETICKESGKKPIPDVCNNDPRGDMTSTEYFAEGTEPKDTDTCDKHIKVSICNASGHIAGLYCPADQVTTSIKIIGEINGSNEDEYRIPPEFLTVTCPLHNGSNTVPPVNSTGNGNSNGNSNGTGNGNSNSNGKNEDSNNNERHNNNKQPAKPENKPIEAPAPAPNKSPNKKPDKKK